MLSMDVPGAMQNWHAMIAWASAHGDEPMRVSGLNKLAMIHGVMLGDVQQGKRLLDDRIIREVTPIFDTRALGYGSMLVAARVDPEHPWRAAKIINEHPGVSHNYLRNHDFNMWFTLAVEEDSKLSQGLAFERLESLREAQEEGFDALADALNGRLAAETAFTWDTIAEQTENCYRS